MEIQCICESQDGLGETPIWVEEEQSLYWADHVGPSLAPNESRRPTVKRLNVATNTLRVWEMPEQVGSFGFRKRGGLIGGTNSGFCAIDLQSGRLDPIVDPEPQLPHNRLNDGKIDRRGRFWCASMDTRVQQKTASIYRLDPDLSCRRVADDLRFVVGNGIAFAPDDHRMYFGDTIGGTVYVFDLDLEEGRITNRRPFYSTAGRTGMVDGATVDADGYYWFALVQGGKILRIDPHGRLDREIDMPIPGPTCVTFGGARYETLYVTSQRAFFSAEQLAAFPQSGNVFAIHGLGVRGLPEPRFAG